MEKEALVSMEREANEHGVVFTKAGLKKLLKPLEENNLVE